MKDGNLGLAEIHALNPYINIRLLQTREEVTFLTKMYTRNFLSLGSFYCLSPCPSRFKKKKTNKQQPALRDIKNKNILTLVRRLKTLQPRQQN